MKKFQEGFLTNFHGNSLSTVLVLGELFLSSSLDSSMAISTLHRPLPHLSSFSQQQRTTRSKPLWVGVPTNRPSSLRVTTPVRFSIGPDQLFLLDADVGYSPASYYTSLGLFVISVPGLWSLIKRSVKSKIVQKTFVRAEGETTTPNQMAGEVLSFFTRNNFYVSDRGETITFEGMMVPSSSQAALLTFCTCVSLGSVALVLSIALPEGGNNWFWLMSLSPLAGAYYWTKASRKEEIKVKMMVGDDGALSEIIVRGDDEQVEQMRKELRLSEKGMVYVKGIFEQ